MPNSTALRVYYNKKAHPSDKTFKSSCACICYKGNDIIHILFLFSDPFNIFVLDFFILFYMYGCSASMYVYIHHVSTDHRVWKKSWDSPEVGEGAGDRAQVLCKSNR